MSRAVADRVRRAVRSPDPIVVTALVVLAARWAVAWWVAPTSVRGVDFDEGAYLSGAALLARGHVPYRDFVLAHPPGFFLLAAPLTWLGRPTTVLLVVRSAVAVAGAASVLLVGRLTRARTSTSAAVVGMAVMAILPDVARADRSVLLEPVLNLLCLVALTTWFGRGPSPRTTGACWRAGAALGAAMTVKWWAVFVVVPLAVTATPGRRARELPAVAGAAVGVAAAVLVPTWAVAGSAAFDQTVRFQLGRADSPWASWTGRAAEVSGLSPWFSGTRALLGTAVVLGGVLVWLRSRRRDPLLGAALAWFAAIAAAFVSGPAYDSQYNAHLGPAVGLVAPFVVVAAREAWRRGSRLVRAPVAVAATVVVALSLHSARWVRGDAIGRTDGAVLAAGLVRDRPGCVFAFEPGWLIAADRWPDPERAGPLASESFVGALAAAVRSGRASEGFDAPAARRATLDAAERCPWVVVGQRGRWQLASAWPEFAAGYDQVETAPGDGPDLWRRRR